MLQNQLTTSSSIAETLNERLLELLCTTTSGVKFVCTFNSHPPPTRRHSIPAALLLNESLSFVCTLIKRF